MEWVVKLVVKWLMQWMAKWLSKWLVGVLDVLGALEGGSYKCFRRGYQVIWPLVYILCLRRQSAVFPTAVDASSGDDGSGRAKEGEDIHDGVLFLVLSRCAFVDLDRGERDSWTRRGCGRRF